jgi:hypothetical protein
MTPRRKYTRPVVIRISLDKSITLMMQSSPMPPMPRSGDSKGTETPFSSPFDDKPFS